MDFALIIVAYLIGSIPFGVILGRRLAGLDVRQEGSGNIGATNVARTAGKKLGTLVLALDALKGALPTLTAMRLFPSAPWIHVGTGGAAIVGHIFPIYLKFRGGKGVATSLGVFAVLTPWAVLAGLTAFAVSLLASRVVFIGSLVGATVTCAVAIASARVTPYTELLALACGLIIIRHYQNIVRFLRQYRAKNYRAGR